MRMNILALQARIMAILVLSISVIMLTIVQTLLHRPTESALTLQHAASGLQQKEAGITTLNLAAPSLYLATLTIQAQASTQITRQNVLLMWNMAILAPSPFPTMLVTPPPALHQPIASTPSLLPAKAGLPSKHPGTTIPNLAHSSPW
jgi:hypothetical protein